MKPFAAAAMKLFATAGLSVSVFVGAASSEGTEGSTLPADGLLLDNGCVPSFTQWAVSGTNTRFGGFTQYQSFTVPSPGWDISKIGIEARLSTGPLRTGLLGRVWPDDGSGTWPDETGAPLASAVYFPANSVGSCDNWRDEPTPICLEPGTYWFQYDNNGDPDYIAAVNPGERGGTAFGRLNAHLVPLYHEPLALRIFGVARPCPRPPFVRLEPDTSSKPPGEQHTVTATVTGAGNLPAPGVDVRFEVTVGPNAGVGNRDGVCTPEIGCTTDPSGVVSFSYVGTNVRGVDEIIAFVQDADGGEAESGVSLMFWDVDCNENGVADQCDIDCAGFDGLCTATACGGSRDDDGDAIPDECNRAPDCTAAYARPSIISPPNRRATTVTVQGVSDEDGDEVTIRVTSIRQDEPVAGPGSGRTGPDASGVGTAAAQVRAERSGSGRDGRVYHIGFSADDGRGGHCEGTVSTCVPHDSREGFTCGDEGPLFDSTEALFPGDR